MTTTNLIVAFILLSLIIVHNIYEKIKYKNSYKDTIYNKTKKLIIFLYILSIIAFTICLIVNLIPYGTNISFKEVIKCILNALSICLLVSPLTLSNLYIYSFKEEEKYSHIKTIITNIFEKKIFNKLKKAHIRVILLSKEKPDYKINSIEEAEITKKNLSKSIHINTDNKKIIDKLINKDNTIYEFNNLNNVIEIIEQSRGVHDNYIRNINYIIRTYLSFIITLIFLIIMKFPIEYNLLAIVLLKVYTIFTSRFLYPKLPYDKDIMERQVKDKSIFIGKQELLFTIIESFCVSFICSIPYMYTVSQVLSTSLGNTLYLTIFMYTQVLFVSSKLNDSFFIINLVKGLKNIRILIYTIIVILIIVSFNYLPIINTRNIELQNNISSILFSFIPVIFTELTKLARFSSKKGRKKKNELKNNKKHRRS